MAPEKPLTEPTERSISPTSSTHTMPSEITPTAQESRIRLTRLPLERKTGLRIWKIVPMTQQPDDDRQGADVAGPDAAQEGLELTAEAVALAQPLVALVELPRWSGRAHGVSSALGRWPSLGRPRCPGSGPVVG